MVPTTGQDRKQVSAEQHDRERNDRGNRALRWLTKLREQCSGSPVAAVGMSSEQPDQRASRDEPEWFDAPPRPSECCCGCRPTTGKTHEAERDGERVQRHPREYRLLRCCGDRATARQVFRRTRSAHDHLVLLRVDHARGRRLDGSGPPIRRGGVQRVASGDPLFNGSPGWRGPRGDRPRRRRGRTRRRS